MKKCYIFEIHEVGDRVAVAADEGTSISSIQWAIRHGFCNNSPNLKGRFITFISVEDFPFRVPMRGFDRFPNLHFYEEGQVYVPYCGP